ncbi:YdeI/OmpD-associated family protein [Pseudonocardia sp. GCM10023141]|uniref:YdeI/OmpD-associated family protein n=1 Tax=Pseudonocardia sp. GCM10023141 TaxID=3252653 RepID=UPI00360AC58B
MDVESVAFETADEWLAWLSEHHDTAADVWLKIAKKGSAMRTLTLTEALDVALCFGWIDSRRRGGDAAHYVQRYSRRRAGGAWSKINVAKVEVLFAAGRMQPAGIAEVDAAKADGRWEAAYASQKEATVPPDLAAALDADPAARRAFEQLDRTNRYAVILGLLKARTPAGRTARLAKALAGLAG